MKISAICNKCGNIADAEFGSSGHNFDTTDTHGSDVKRMVKIDCNICGAYQRPPHCHVDHVDTSLLRLLVL